MTIDQRFNSLSPPLPITYSPHHRHHHLNLSSSSHEHLDHYSESGPSNMAINLDVDPDSVWRDFPPQPPSASSSYVYNMQQSQQPQSHQQQQQQHQQQSSHHQDHRQQHSSQPPRHPHHQQTYPPMNQPQHPVHPQHRYSNGHPPPMLKTYSDEYPREAHNGYIQGYGHDNIQGDGTGYDPYHSVPPPTHPTGHPYAGSGSGSGSGSSPGQGLQTRPTTADAQYQRQDQYQQPHPQTYSAAQSYHPQQSHETSSDPSPINPREMGLDSTNLSAAGGGAGGASAGAKGSTGDQTPTSPQGGGNSSSTNKKRRHNVGKACENCRRRRVKCDGVQPHCGTCKVYNDECSWNPREDYRKPLSRQQVEALRTRVADLERMLRDNGLDPGGTSGAGKSGGSSEQGLGKTSGPSTTTAIPVTTSTGSAGGTKTKLEERDEEREGSGLADGPGDMRDWAQSHLVENESGDFQVYGPTSAFRHLGKHTVLVPDRPPHPHSQSHSRSYSQQDAESSPGAGFGSPYVGDFRRYLPRDILLSEEQHEAALDRFFRYYAPWGQRTHPILFREDMATALNSDTPVKTSHYSPMLHNAILSIGLCYCDEPQLRTPAFRKVFVTEAKKHVEIEGKNPTVATVQALAHLASGHSVDAEHNLGWLYIGMALRCALALGLNMDNTAMLKSGKISETQARERNVTYWTAFIQEGLWAPYIGRPVYVPECTTPLPTVDEQLDNLIWIPHEIPGRVVELSLKPQPGMVSSTFVETVKLMDIGARIMNTLYGIKSDIATLTRSGVISEISLSLSTWLERLPPTLVLNSHSAKHALPHILMMHLSWAWLVILLHRPFYRPLAGMPGNNSKSPTSGGYNAALAVKHCDRAAIQIVALLQTWHRLHDLRFTPPTALQCCFVAGTTHLLSFATSRTEKKKQDALNRAQDCIRLMSYMAVSWPAAQQKQKFLEDLLVEYGMTGGPVSGENSNASAESSSKREQRLAPPVVVVKTEPQPMPPVHQLLPKQQHQAPSCIQPMPSFPQHNTSMVTDYGMPQTSGYVDPIMAVQNLSMSNNPTSHIYQQPLSTYNDEMAHNSNFSHPPVHQLNMQAAPSHLAAAQSNQLVHQQTQPYMPVHDYGMQFGNFNYSLPPTDSQPLEAEWDPNNFVTPDVPSQRYTQALFDHIMQPHLQLGVHSQPPPHR